MGELNEKKTNAAFKCGKFCYPSIPIFVGLFDHRPGNLMTSPSTGGDVAGGAGGAGGWLGFQRTSVVGIYIDMTATAVAIS